MTPAITESTVEDAALDWLAGAWPTGRTSRRLRAEGVLEQRLRDALALLNPDLPASAMDDTFRKLTPSEWSTLETRNRTFHRMAVSRDVYPRTAV